jgi:hypothetical protein
MTKTQAENSVQIDSSFVAEQAKGAVRQFFRPLTSAFETPKSSVAPATKGDAKPLTQKPSQKKI